MGKIILKISWGKVGKVENFLYICGIFYSITRPDKIKEKLKKIKLKTKKKKKRNEKLH